MPDGTQPDTPPAASPPIELQTERLVLRRWRDSDRAPFAAMNADPQVMRYFPEPLDASRSNAAIDGWLAHFDARGWSNWAVERRADATFIGFIGLSVPKRTFAFSPCVEIGWRLAAAHWHRGYATEGARAALRAGFEQIGLARIVSFTSLANSPSRAVMERIGLRDTHADFDHPAIAEGHPLRRHCLYALARDEWHDSSTQHPVADAD